jgi:hypothetical protein
VLWLSLLALLLRRANRTTSAWAILVPIGMVYLVLHVVERALNSYFLFNDHQYLCSSFSELAKLFALAVGILLAVSDQLTMRNRFYRGLWVSFILMGVVGIGIGFEAWPFLSAVAWILLFGVVLLLFMVSHACLKALLSRLTGPARWDLWYAGSCGILGILPILIPGILEIRLDRIGQLQSSLEMFRFLITLGAAVSLPYSVLLGFVLWARFNPFCRDRLARSLGGRSQ